MYKMFFTKDVFGKRRAVKEKLGAIRESKLHLIIIRTSI